MVMNVRLLGVVSLLFLLRIVMTVRQLGVIVGMGMPRNAVVNLTVVIDVMRKVPVIVLMGHSRMGVLGFAALACGVLLFSHCYASFLVTRTVG